MCSLRSVAVQSILQSGLVLRTNAFVSSPFSYPSRVPLSASFALRFKLFHQVRLKGGESLFVVGSDCARMLSCGPVG